MRAYFLLLIVHYKTHYAARDFWYVDETYTDVVELPSLKREEGKRKLKLQAFGKEIYLDLHRTEDLLPTDLPVHVYGEDEDGKPTLDDWTHRVSII